MTFPTSIRATVSPGTIDKVGRLFNGGAADVLAELLQNARRAGAGRVDIEILDLAGHTTLRIRDDGRGIEDPQLLLTLGRSDWAAGTLASEDPAGMGIFAMAGLRVEYRSHSAAAGRGWRVVIEPDAWSGRRLLAIEPFEIASGTEVLIDMPEAWEATIERELASVARHYPLPVFLHGLECSRQDWLGGALHVERWMGCRIGVFHESRRASTEKALNFHGLTVPYRLPAVGEVDKGLVWTVRVDIDDMPELQLVLPARKEVVQTPFLERLKVACEAAIFRAIAKDGAHRLAFADHVRARALGVLLGEADPMLFGWHEPTAEASGAVRGEPTRRPMIVMADLEPAIAQTVARAVVLNDGLDLSLVESTTGFVGYEWYDALEWVEDVRILVRQAGVDHIVRDEDRGALATGAAETIVVELDIRAADGSKRVVTMPTDIAILPVEDWASDLDAIAVLVAPGATIAIPDMVDLLMGSAFRPSDDRDADSWETQRDNFERDALQLARSLLVSEEAGIIGRALGRIDDHIRWLVPEGRTLLIAVNRDEAVAAMQERDAVFADEAAFARAVLGHANSAPVDPQGAFAALGKIRMACQERALDLIARAGADRAQEGRGEAG